MNFKELFLIEQEKEYYINLQKFLDEEYNTKTIFPPREEIFSAFKYCDIPSIKVIIIGQDPYHEIGQAHGLAFSVKSGTKLPKSLINIYKELYDDLGITRLSGDLSDWAEQGVFMLNTVLTVEEGKADSHKNRGWEIFTSTVIEKLNEDNSPKVFVLWGNNAIKNFKDVISNPVHHLICSAHPSPLSAYRGFFGSKPFSKINEYLISDNLSPIDWR